MSPPERFCLWVLVLLLMLGFLSGSGRSGACGARRAERLRRSAGWNPKEKAARSARRHGWSVGGTHLRFGRRVRGMAAAAPLALSVGGWALGRVGAAISRQGSARPRYS